MAENFTDHQDNKLNQNQDTAQNNSVSFPQKQKAQISTRLGFVVIICVTVLFFGAVFITQFYLIQKLSAQNQNEIINAQNLSASSEIAGWKTYTNNEYGFEIKYPVNWFVVWSKWTPGGAEYSKENINKQKRVIITSQDLTLNKDIYESQYLQIDSDNYSFWAEEPKSVDDFWGKLDKTDQKTGEIVNKFLDKKMINGTDFIFFNQYGWSVKYQKKIWTPLALTMGNGEFFWIRGGDTISNELFEKILSTFKFIK